MTDEHASGRHEDVAAVGEAIAQWQNARETGFERRGQFLSFRNPARRAGPEQDRRVAEHQRRIFDENRIRKLLERRQNGEVDAGRAQCGDIGAVLGDQRFKVGRGTGSGAQAVDDALAGCADDGGIEVEDAHEAILAFPNR